MKQGIHFSGLNGLRAIAALAVVFGHTAQDLPYFGLRELYFGRYANGEKQLFFLTQYSVTIFFALSGFLITYLLLEEKKKTGTISIRHFYIRRILRIWPLYYFYLALSLISLWLFDIPFNGALLPFYIFLTANIPFILKTPIRFITHYWSLGVEEQFYAWWPWVMKVSGKVLRNTFLCFMILLLAKLSARVWDIRFNDGHVSLFYETLHTTKFDCMLIGALGAILYFRKNSLFLSLTDNYAAQLISWIIIVLISFNKFQVVSVLNHEIVSFVTVTIIIGQIGIRRRIINLENRVMDFIGKISYGIYIYHVLVIFYLSRFIHAGSGAFGWFLFVFVSVMAISILISWYSYHYFEKRFLLLKQKFTAVSNQPV